MLLFFRLSLIVIAIVLGVDRSDANQGLSCLLRSLEATRRANAGEKRDVQAAIKEMERHVASKVFIAGRTLEEYRSLFNDLEFHRITNRMTRDSVWIDMGAGDCMAIRDYLIM